MPKREELVNPGAGTLFVYGELDASGDSDKAWDDLPTSEPLLRASPDSLLRRGVADYTYLPASAGGVLGRGKFSTVYKVVGADGHYYALKHTPLYPHHPLISARLLREPTLLAQLPPHPCLIGVDGWVRTDGHFYLVEQFAASHVPLPSHLLPLTPSRAAYILDQLVSVVRDGLHEGGRVCHRDLKGENVLVDVDTGDILLLDLGLATHFSMSQPKLTTCCGSPAFHSPEIVLALSKPPGEVTYYGPELDIWCIALTLLSLLTQTRFPLGPSHTSRYIMAERARDRLQELDELYPPEAPWRALGPSRRFTSTEKAFELSEWTRVRRAMSHFLEIDGLARMRHFKNYDEGDRVRARVEEYRAKERGSAGFKSITFIPSEVKYTLPLRLEPDSTTTPMLTPGPLVLHNPTGESERRVVSYIKYLLRSAGIVYHHLPASSPPLLQLVLPLAPPTPPSSLEIPPPLLNVDTGGQARDWMSTLLGLGRRQPARSASVPPKQTRVTPPPAQSSGGGKKGKKEWAQVCWMRIDVERSSSFSSASTTRRSGSAHPGSGSSRASSRTRFSGDASTLLFSPVQSKATLAAPVVVDGLAPLPERPVHSRQPSNRSVTVTGIATVPLPQGKFERAESFLSPLSRQVSPSEQQQTLAPLSPTEVQRPNISRQSTTSLDGGIGVGLGMTSASSSGTSSIPAPLLPAHSTISTRHPRAHSQGGTGTRRAPSRARSHVAPTVTITLSEPRGYDLVRRALDVVHIDSPVTAVSSMSGRSSVRPIPASSGSEADDDSEPQRGRPRSKESQFERPTTTSMGAFGATLGVAGQGTSGVAVAGVGGGVSAGTGAGAARGGQNNERSTSTVKPNTEYNHPDISPTNKLHELVVTLPVPDRVDNGNNGDGNGTIPTLGPTLGNGGGDYPSELTPRRVRNPSHTRRSGLFETLFGKAVGGGGGGGGTWSFGAGGDGDGASPGSGRGGRGREEGRRVDDDEMRVSLGQERRSSSVPPIGPLAGV